MRVVILKIYSRVNQSSFALGLLIEMFNFPHTFPYPWQQRHHGQNQYVYSLFEDSLNIL